jgi:hypothetical protein
MSYRRLVEGTSASYDELNTQLLDGEVLVATWLRDPAMTPNARPVNGESDYVTIIAKTKAGYYVQLRFFASTTASEDYYAYNADSPRSSLLAEALLGVSTPAAPYRPYAPPRTESVAESNWGEPFRVHLTREWQEIVPGLRMKKIYPTTVTYGLLNGNQWSHDYGASLPNDWFEFTPGIQMRKSDKPGITEFRQKDQ